MTWSQSVFVELDVVTSRSEVVAETDGERGVLVVAIADEDTLAFDRLLENEVVVAVFADLKIAFLAEDHARGGSTSGSGFPHLDVQIRSGAK